MSGIRCRRKYCTEVMAPGTDGHGMVVFVCRGCDRNRRGLCRDCPARKAPRSMRCLACRRRRHLELARRRDRERYPARRDQVLAHHRKQNKNPLHREHRRRYMQAYRAQQPRDANDRAYQRAYMAAKRADPAYRARQNARKRVLREIRKLARQLTVRVA